MTPAPDDAAERRPDDASTPRVDVAGAPGDAPRAAGDGGTAPADEAGAPGGAAHAAAGPAHALGEPASAWRRPHWESGGGDALVLFVVLAREFGELRATRAVHRVSAMPRGVESAFLTRDADGAAFEALAGGPFASAVDVDGVPLRDAAADMRVGLRLMGTVPDPADLRYLRDTIGLVTSALDAGGALVIQPQAVRATAARSWRNDVFAGDAPRGANHVSFMRTVESLDDGGRFRVHTRGMRLFGRPDVSIGGVSPDLLQAAADVLVLLCEWQIRGTVIPEGQPITFVRAFDGWVCRHRGSFDDPRFHNRHVAVEPG